MIWKIADVMAYTGLSRKAVVRMLNNTDAPLLPREKNETFRVPSEAFKNWWQGGQYDKI